MIQNISGYSYESGLSNNVSSLKGAEVSGLQSEALKGTGKIECQTCKSRKYQDGSGEMVSFKSPGHISPGASAGVVMSHEQEHVSNAYSKAAKGNGQVVRASVSLQTSVCPECGKGYVSGGTTSTTIKYQEDNPYSQNAKSRDFDALSGNNIDLAV